MTAEIDLGDLLDAYAITRRGFIVAVNAPVEPPAEWVGVKIGFNARSGRKSATVLGVERIHSCLIPRTKNDILYLFVAIDGIAAEDVNADVIVHNPDTTCHFS